MMFPTSNTFASILQLVNGCGSARQIIETITKITKMGIRFLVIELVFMAAKILDALSKICYQAVTGIKICRIRLLDRYCPEGHNNPLADASSLHQQ
jgi:hypothetical protein